MAFESRDGEAKQGIFGVTEPVMEAWSRIAKNFTVSLPGVGRGGWIWFDWV
jgi:hypothetical protein